jgi:D-3-phosphoglycerate dehydrogenase
MSVVKMAPGFNMKILGFDPLAAPKEAEQLGVEVTDDLTRIYKESDFISLHIPRNEQTLNMIGAEQIAMMKPTCRIVNCARGGIINEDALYDALAENKIAGAALDVFAQEPPENTRFQELPNCLVTPHLGASTEEAQIEVAVEAARILCDAIKGGPIQNALNAPAGGGSVPPVVQNYAGLAHRIGSIMSVVAPGHIKGIQVEYRGAIAEQPVDGVTTGFAIGLLQPHFDTTINMVNVGLMAKDRGISIDEVKNADVKDVVSSFTAKVETDKVTRAIKGTVFGHGLLRIIDIDGFNAEVTPEGTLIVIFNDDKPGVIGSVGTLCGRHGINISTMGVGHKAQEGQAMLAVSLDKEPEQATVDELKALDFVNEIYVCKLS